MSTLRNHPVAIDEQRGLITGPRRAGNRLSCDDCGCHTIVEAGAYRPSCPNCGSYELTAVPDSPAD